MVRDPIRQRNDVSPLLPAMTTWRPNKRARDDVQQALTLLLNDPDTPVYATTTNEPRLLITP